MTFDLELGPEERTLLVSGPNTGGKTVIVKAVGLIAALAQSGVIPPVGEGTALPVFSALFADIGDRQSIQESLSTFSAHVAALRDILERADAGPAGAPRRGGIRHRIRPKGAPWRRRCCGPSPHAAPSPWPRPTWAR